MIEPSEWLSLNQFIHDIKQVDSQCISVYYPYGKGKETISLLQKTHRNKSLEKIELEIEKRIIQLKRKPTSAGKFTKTMCIFGWIKNGKILTKEIGTSKSLPYIYMASKKPYIKPFRDILKANYNVILVTLDQKTAKIQKIHGDKIIQEASLGIDLRGRHRKGGQSQGRFQRARKTKIHVFFKNVADKLRKMDSDSELILIGGTGSAKENFLGMIDSRLQEKCMMVDDLSFSTPQKEVHKKIISKLYRHRRKHVSRIISKYDELVKEGLTAKKNDVIYKALQNGRVETLIVSADYHTDSQFNKIMKMLELAKMTSAKIEFVSSPKVLDRLKINDSVLAILRYRKN
ncbi:MAG: peptide chain release factor 1 [Crenarchaeota archaeon]|nr:MAG: peptide chain release factor 1 [Thermoproteota archaeon]RDJ34351.1 MAG: peptide chain release factor 1 [Thermoproteota archaeon]RDJ37187.1 MAG: peptide chain release factor 1 [Thermoproteota archaeon]RDJ37644.1 MAG: peptide chain release factor 1 [Thermoproteota archaeon]